MSDYISKSEAVESLKKYKFGAICNDEEREYTKETVLVILNGIPTLDEKEIICKAFERVIQQLSEQMPIRFNGFGKTLITIEDVIKILKEECGINE